jgi:threonine aldolase
VTVPGVEQHLVAGRAVDLRSDTVTRPTPEMRRAMAGAEVGDDGYGEDPTVAALEAAYAERVGKEVALFVPSGTMANQIALRVLCPAGSTVVVGRRQHVVLYEAGAAASNAGVQLHPVDDEDGTFPAEALTAARRAAAHHQPTPGLVCVEQTHMASGGRVWSVGALEELAGAAGDLPVHMDGARLFNAEVATGVPAAAYAAAATTVMSCLSKGLCAPVGSVLAGPADLMERARLARQRLGGAMRQAGVVAAAGLLALGTMVERLAEDHERARRLAAAVAERWPGAGCHPDQVPTNIVVFRHPDTDALLAHLRGEGVLAGTIAPGVVRLVTHRDVDDAGVERAVKAMDGAP